MPGGKDAAELAGIGALGVKVVDDLAQLSIILMCWIDFTRPDASMEFNRAVPASGQKKIVIGTTGYSDAQKAAISEAAKDVSIVLCAQYECKE